MTPVRAIAVVGPTASGKTAFGISLARELGGEIVSVDSRQVFRGFDIGTAKPTAAERAAVPHHLIDCADPGEAWTAARHAGAAADAIRGIAARGRVPVLVGGTYFRVRDGLSPMPPRDAALRARLEGIVARGGLPRLRRWLARADPARAAAILPNDPARVVRALELLLATGERPSDLLARPKVPALPHSLLAFCLAPATRSTPASTRTDACSSRGSSRRAAARAPGDPAAAGLMETIGYRETLDLLDGKCDRVACAALVAMNTRRFAKRQLTWFRKERDLVRLDPDDPGAACRALEAARAFLSPAP
jgi:tRNA dimethylallyltransferase